MEGLRLRQHISRAIGVLLGVATLLAAAPSSAAPVVALVAPALSSTQQPAATDASGVQIARVYENRGDSDIVSFPAPDADATQTNGSVTGFSLALPLHAAEHTATSHVFGFTSAPQDTLSLPWNQGSVTQAIGMQVELTGGAQATFAMQNGASGGLFPVPSQQPAVFAFYNFPQTSAALNLRAFGAGDAAAAQTAANPPATSQNVLSSPLISALSSQGPFWYNGAAPAKGMTFSLTLPFRVAKIPVKVRLGEQSVADVPTSSLANQILGPAFASSALQYNAVSGGVSVALPVLSRRATVSLDGLYETLQQGNQGPFSLMPYVSQSAAASSPPSTVIFTPTSGVQHYAGAASVALPVTSRLTVNGSFSEQISGNVALDALTQTLTQHQTGYSGGVAYDFPKTNSSIGFFSNRSVFTNDNLPNYNVTQNSQNLYFSVKF